MNYYNEIKNTLIDVGVYKTVKDYSKNKYELEKYYQVGKLLIEAQGGESRNEYGNKLIKLYADKLTNELGHGYSWRNLYNMRLFYIKFNNYEILQTLSTKLSWSHLNELFRINDDNKIYYYINITNTLNLSVRELRDKIKLNEYERLDDSTKLKVTTLAKEHIGQIEIYMNYIDKYVKKISHDKTIGIIITKHGNDFIMEFCSDPRIYNTTYELV